MQEHIRCWLGIVEGRLDLHSGAVRGRARVSPAGEKLVEELKKLQTHDPDAIPMQGGDYGKIIKDEKGRAHSVVYKFTRDNRIPVVTTLTGGYPPERSARMSFELVFLISSESPE